MTKFHGQKPDWLVCFHPLLVEWWKPTISPYVPSKCRYPAYTIPLRTAATPARPRRRPAPGRVWPRMRAGELTPRQQRPRRSTPHVDKETVITQPLLMPGDITAKMLVGRRLKSRHHRTNQYSTSTSSSSGSNASTRRFFQYRFAGIAAHLVAGCAR